MIHPYFLHRETQFVSKFMSYGAMAWQRALFEKIQNPTLPDEVRWRILGVLRGSFGYGNNLEGDPRDEPMDVVDLLAWLRKNDPGVLQALRDFEKKGHDWHTYRNHLSDLHLIRYTSEDSPLTITESGQALLAAT